MSIVVQIALVRESQILPCVYRNDEKKQNLRPKTSRNRLSFVAVPIVKPCHSSCLLLDTDPRSPAIEPARQQRNRGHFIPSPLRNPTHRGTPPSPYLAQHSSLPPEGVVPGAHSPRYTQAERKGPRPTNNSAETHNPRLAQPHGMQETSSNHRPSSRSCMPNPTPPNCHTRHNAHSAT